VWVQNPGPGFCEPTFAANALYDSLQYEHWLREVEAKSSPSAYLFFEPRLRFFPEADDILVLVPEVKLERSRDTAVLVHTPTRTRVPLEGLEADAALRISSHVDGEHSVFGVQRRAKVSVAQLDRFLALTFGTLVLAPRTLERFDGRLSASGLVRFPGSPYELDRSYWANQIDVRTAVEREFSEPQSTAEFVKGLTRLHALALMGQSGRSFYRPSSPIVAKAGARAGALYDVETRMQEDADTTLLLDGPRVSAPHVGGRRYHELLCRELDDEGALEATRELAEPGGMPWGRVVLGMARADVSPLPWFVPPRPLREAHFERLNETWQSCLAGSALSEVAPILGSFHWLFVRLHPFVCANQSLGMNLVNFVIEQHGACPIPHLVLDQMALRFSEAAYTALFVRAVGAWSEPAPALPRRAFRLIEQRKAMDRLLVQLTESRSLEECEQRVKADPEGGMASLLVRATT
jgi:hypothetical protein